jgi:hypothetical protein
MPDERRFEGEDIVDWGVRTGRFTQARAPFWRQQLADERRRVQASADKSAESLVEATISMLAPVLAPDTDAGSQVWAKGPDGRTVWAGAYGAASSATPMLDELEERLYGPSQVERHRREDLAAERELAEFDQAEASRVAASALTADEMRALFGESGE